MIKSIKIKLKPNNKQRTKLVQYANTARFAYNWAIGKEEENYKNGGKFIYDNDLRKEFTQLKKQEDYLWLNDVSNNVTKQAIKDACNTYKRFFKGQCKYPKFKSKRFSTPSFYQDTAKIQFNRSHVKMEGFSSSKKVSKQKLNWIRLAEKNRIPFGDNMKYTNPRITFDGLDWFLSVGMECADCKSLLNDTGIGIDLGLKELAICSDCVMYKNINKTHEVKKLEKRKHRLQRKVSNKYELNKKGKEYCRTNHIKKLEQQLLKLNHRLTNIRHDYTHQVTSEIVKRKPSFIVLEDLNVSGMMKNQYLSKAVQQQSFYEFRRQMEYKCEWYKIDLVIADRWFPSSKLCSCCGNIKRDLKLKDRIYKCSCGNTMDRDYQASLNLMKYGKRELEKQSVDESLKRYYR